MLPSSTVENYLKAVYVGVRGLGAPERLLPMGQLASALGVTPGTATTMVKTLAEAGLVQYEPYAGVALTPAGERLAALVLRRHRLVELFLVRVMGYAWDEVHDEAEQLEHVVSDRLIERMDEMLGRPEADPHGDPIPNSEGRVKEQTADTLLTCPLHTPVTVTRVIDQDRAFLRFIENHDLKPGEAIEVEHRDTASDSVRVRGKNDQRITIGSRAASKLMVQVARALALVALLAGTARAQSPTATTPAAPPKPFAITDNSLLIEEAFNQDAGVVQTMFTIHAARTGDWESALTQEWPLLTHRHQVSYTLNYSDVDGARALGDTAINYRLQVSDERSNRPAFAPRVSLILPTARSWRREGGGNPAWEMNLPFSKQAGDVYVHWNGGFTHDPAEKNAGRSWNLLTPRAGASVIWRARPMFHLMLESLIESRDEVHAGVPRRYTALTVSPGLRTGWNRGDAQTVVAIGVPIERESGSSHAGLFAYASYETRFRK